MILLIKQVGQVPADFFGKMSERPDRLIPREGTDPYGWRLPDEEIARLIERVFGFRIGSQGTAGRRDDIRYPKQDGLDLGGKVLKGIDLGRKDARLGRSF